MFLIWLSVRAQLQERAIIAMGCCISVDPDRPADIDDPDHNNIDTTLQLCTPEIVGAPVAKEWYHGNISNNEAEERLKFAAKEDGNYLVYDFYNEAGPVHGEYNLLVYYDGGKVYRRKDKMGDSY